MKKLTLILAVALATPLMTGCMGQMGLTKAATAMAVRASTFWQRLYTV